MNRIFYAIGVAIIAFGLCFLMIIFSLKLGGTKSAVVKTTETKTWSTVRLIEKSDNVYDPELTVFDIHSKNLSKDTPVLVQFWRLGSFLYLSSSGSQSTVLNQKSNTGIVIGDVSGIVSLYDLFLQYVITDTSESFSLEQVTNGSFYIGKEEEWKIAIYAIDGVVRLTFLYEWVEMTNMLLFPGSYIRFDPSKNRSLKSADLFRTILSLQAEDNEVFEFINPRINRGDEDDVFFNYRLRPESKILFRALSSIFRKKVENIDIRKRYAISSAYDSKDVSSLQINPTKNDYSKLTELKFLLSRAVDSAGASTDLVKKIWRAYNEAKDLKISNSNARSIVEQFLLDGRFALYGGIVNSRYQETYESIAQIIGIQPTSGKARLLQTLSDIYSRNLFTQKRSTNRIKIDTYWPTASELSKTLENKDIDQKDYFDIAIYAWNILDKTQESNLFDKSTLEDTSTYTYLSVFFQASRLYIDSIADTQKKQQTVMSFSRQFYDSLITTLSRSLYKNFATVEDGAVYPISDFRDGIKLKISDEFTQNITTLNTLIEILSSSIDPLWSSSGSSDDDAYSRIQHEILRIQAFSKMISSDTYKEYIKTPYKADPNESIALPLVEEAGKKIVTFDPAIIEKSKNTKALSADPRIKELQKIWPNADAASWVLDGEYIRVIRAPYSVARWDVNSSIEISALYKNNLLSDIIIFYGDYTIEVTGDGFSAKGYYSFISDIQYYLDTIDATITQDTKNVWSLRIFPFKQRISIGDNVYTIKTK